MDENRFNEYDNEATQEMESILGEDGGIIPRKRFTEDNSAADEEDFQRTRMMDSVNYSEPRQSGTNPVKRRKKRRKKKKQYNHTRTMGQIFLGVLLSVGAVAAGVFLAVQVVIGLQDYTGMAKTPYEREVVVTQDMGVDDIAQMLSDKGIIKMPKLFTAYLRISDKESGFLNGEYVLKSNMSYSNIVTALKTVKTYTETVMVMIPEGATAKQVGEILEENYVCRAEDFLVYYKSKQNRFDFEEGIADDPLRFNVLEGYLFPDTYEFYVIDDLKEDNNFDTLQYAKQAADKMYSNFENKITKAMYARMDELGMTLDEVVILASLIQKEGTNEDNMSMISSVFHNRMNERGTFPKLQSDTTDTYINNCIKPYVNSDSGDLFEKVIAAYDTYSCEGLPAGAICNPGIVAINAALYPADTDFFYFLASSDGVFYFAQTVEEHEQNIIDAALRDED